jgi:uncharacterized RDD family membrane protein YckC
MEAHQLIGTLPTQAYTSWIRRVGAFIIDQILYLILAVIVDAGGGLIVAAAGGSSRLDRIVDSIIYLAVVAYLIWNWGYRQGKTGSTIGKSVLKFKVVDQRDGQPIGFRLSIVRYFAHFFDSIILNIGYLLPLFTAKRQTIADMIMGTVCLPIEPPGTPPHQPPPAYGAQPPPTFDVHDTQLAAAGAAPLLPPPPGQPLPWAQPGPRRPGWRRPRVVVPAMVAIVLVIGGGIFAGVKISQPHGNTPTIAAPPPAPPPNTGPFTGTYTGNFAAETWINDQPVEGATPTNETWGLRSVCRPDGCVATAARRSGKTVRVSTLVFDDVGGRWVAVGVGPGTCDNAPAEYWVVITLQPHPDGTLSGEYSTVTTNGCNGKRAVTFTRTADVDPNSLPDPAGQPPRVVSPAEALHGRYHSTTTYAVNTSNQEYDDVVRTDCLRTGDRCLSFFHNPDSGVALVFGSGTWTSDTEFDSQCPGGGTTHQKITAQYPLPVPPQDPITLLTGHGHQEGTGLCTSSDFDEKFVRTGD